MSRWEKLPAVDLATNEWVRRERTKMRKYNKYMIGIPSNAEIEAFRKGYLTHAKQAHDAFRKKHGYSMTPPPDEVT